MKLLIIFLLILSIVARNELFESDILSSDDETLSNGVMFNEETTILLAEKFINVEFFVPYPQFNITVRREMDNALKRLNQMWTQPSVHCNLDFTTNFNRNDSGFNVDWLIKAIESEVLLAEQEIGNLHRETSQFLNGAEVPSSTRKRRNALAAIGLFGSGVLLGGQGGCGLLGIFGTCQDKSKANAENITRVADYTEQVATFVSKIKSKVDKKFYLVSEELKELKTIQQQMAETQNKNWEIVEEQFAVFEKNMHALNDCYQQIYARQQINFNFDTISSLLYLIYTNIKSYRSALYSYHTNMLNSIPSLLKRYLPMSLVSRNSMLSILAEVAKGLVETGDRLSLASPMPDLLSYYDAQLLRDVISLPEGLVMTLSIPLASSQTALKVYRAQILPMPQDEAGTALQWKLEAPYLAVSEDMSETAHLTEHQLSNCIGSSRYQICHESMATERSHTSCLAALFFGTAMDAVRVCETENVYLPAVEKAENLGHGIWLITSATTSYSLVESNMDPRNKGIVRYPGCSICVVTLECGRQLQGPNIKIRSDLSSCRDTPPIKITVKLPVPLQQLLTTLPEVENLPYFTSKTDASVHLLRNMRSKLQKLPHVDDSAMLKEIAEPMAYDMQLLKPSLVKELDSYLPLKMSLIISVCSFLGSMVLHLLCMYLYHRCHTVRRLVPRILKLDKEKIKMKPVVTVDAEHYPKVTKHKKNWTKRFVVLRPMGPNRKTMSKWSLNTANTPKLSRSASRASAPIPNEDVNHYVEWEEQQIPIDTGYLDMASEEATMAQTANTETCM